jgi:hypothetical protein
MNQNEQKSNKSNKSEVSITLKILYRIYSRYHLSLFISLFDHTHANLTLFYKISEYFFGEY